MPNFPSLNWSLATAWFSEVLEVFWPAIAVFLGAELGYWIFIRITDAIRGPDYDDFVTLGEDPLYTDE